MRTRSIVEALLKACGVRVGHTAHGTSRCWRQDVRSEADIRTAAFSVAPPARQEVTIAQRLLRELVSLNTPALYLNVVHRPGPVRVILRPWAASTIRFRGPNYFVDAGAESTEGMGAFLTGPHARVKSLYPTTPDHPVYAISIENQQTRDVMGSVPSFLTHMTLVVNGRIVTRCERLLHERGPQIWAA